MNTSAPKQVALYARVSTKGLGQDPEGQLISLRDYAERRGWTVVGEYVDNGYSGAKSNTRPALQRLWKDARQRKFDVVAVWKLDRFGRSLRDLVNSLDEFRSLGIEFVSLTEAIDFGSSLGAVMFALIGVGSKSCRSHSRLGGLPQDCGIGNGQRCECERPSAYH